MEKWRNSWLTTVVAMAFLYPAVVLAEDIWELRDKSNVIQVTIDSSNELDGATLDASEMTTGTLPDARLSANVTQLGSSIETGEITSLNADKINAGELGSGVIASSVAVNSIGSDQVTDGAIVNADVNASAAIAASKLQSTVMVEGENVSLLNNDSSFISSTGENTFTATQTYRAADSGAATSLWQDENSVGVATMTAAGALTISGNLDASGLTEGGSNTLSNDVSGNAATATALAADPSDCSAGEFANAIAASGNLTCSADGSSLTSLNASNISSGELADARLSSNVPLLNSTNTWSGQQQYNQTTTHASSVTVNAALGASGTIDGGGFTEGGSSTLTNSIDGNAGTATALAADPSDCAAGEFANAIAASGNLTCSADGSSLTTLNASNISSGELADARLSSNVPLLNSTNTWSGQNQFDQTTTHVSSVTVNALFESLGLVFEGAFTAANLRSEACAAHDGTSKGCIAYNVSDFDLYTSTGSSAGQWRNSRTGVGP